MIHQMRLSVVVVALGTFPKNGVSQICSEKLEQLEEIGTERGIPENKKRKSEQIGGRRAGKLEQIGVTPLLVTPNRGSEYRGVLRRSVLLRPTLFLDPCPSFQVGKCL